jgi:hypothetical protein
MDIKEELNSKLLTEALFVGTFLVPTYALTHLFVSGLFPRMSDTTQDYVSVFFAGGLFHLLCEETGINQWYLDNGVATLKRQDAYTDLGMWNDDGLCDGRCGWRDDGVCSHYSLHSNPSA